MTDQEIRIAIAEACGWTKCGTHSPNMEGDCIMRKEPTEQRIVSATLLPDYCNDLNAMHEAEKSLSEKHLIDYTMYFGAIHSNPALMMWSGIHATARQRAEAFLRTLGKWTDTTPHPKTTRRQVTSKHMTDLEDDVTGKTRIERDQLRQRLSEVLIDNHNLKGENANIEELLYKANALLKAQQSTIEKLRGACESAKEDSQLVFNAFEFIYKTHCEGGVVKPCRCDGCLKYLHAKSALELISQALSDSKCDGA